MGVLVLQGPRRATGIRPWTIAVPADTASIVMQTAPAITVGEFVDTIFAPEVNSVLPGTHVVRRLVRHQRSVCVCIRTSSLLASAPAGVATLVTTLLSLSEQSYALYATVGGDVWIVGNSANALRHGGYDYIDRVGIRYLAPHPAWRINSTRGTLELVANEVMTPTIKSFNWNPGGGLGSTTLPPGLPGRAAAVGYWDLWKPQTRNPSEFAGGFTDGDEAFSYDRFQELDGDHSLLARSIFVSAAVGVGSGPLLLTGLSTFIAIATDGTYVITISTGGALGVAQYTFTFNGGAASSPAVLPSVAFSLPGYPGVTIAPPTGTYVAGTTYTWTVTTKRGYANGDYPTGNCAAMPNVYPKLCTTHHGASGTGSYPAAPAGPSPWVGLAVGAWHESCSVNPPGGAITPDAVADNATNPSPNFTAFGGLIKFHGEHKVQFIAEQMVLYGAPHPRTKCFSSEPNDGANFCFCSKCVNLLRSGPYAAYLTAFQKTQDASDTDKVAHVMNEDAKYAAYMYQNALDANGNAYVPMIGALGYVTHGDPPAIPIQPNTLFVSLVTTQPYSIVGTLPSELIPKWSTKRATNPFGQFSLGVTTLWLSDASTFVKPGFPSPKQAATYLKDWISKGSILQGGETGASHLIQGLQLRLMSALCWRPNLDVDAFITEDLTLAYGPAATAVRALYDRWWQWFETCPQSVAVGMAAMQTVQAALDAAPDPVSPDGRANVQRRINHLKGLLEWERRYTEYFAARVDYDNPNLTSGGGATQSVVLYGGRVTPSVIRVEIDGAGGAGVGTFKWTKNADATTIVWEQTAQLIPAVGSPVALGTTGRSATFPTATYSVGWFWSEAPATAALLTAYDRVFSWAWSMASTNAINSYRMAGGVGGRIYNSVPHPISNSKEGTAPPALTVVSQVAAGISPTSGTSSVELDCTTLGALGTAVLRYRVNGVGSWTSFTTPASSSTPVTLALAGIQIKCAAGPYAVNNLWHITIAPQLGKWDWTNAAAPCNGSSWAGMTEPTKADMDTLVTSGVTAYPQLSGVTRKVYDETSFQSFNVSAATTLIDGPSFQFPHKHVIKTPANPTTIKLRTSGLGGATVGVPVRVVLKTVQVPGGPPPVTLQEWFFTGPVAPLFVINDMVITQPPGVYQLIVVDSLSSASASRLQVPQNVGCVLVNDWFDAPATPALPFDQTKQMYFYGPDAGETKICAVFSQLWQGNVPKLQFYDPTGTPVTTTYTAPNQWTCNVGAYTNQPWSLTGWAARSNENIVQFENCVNRLAPSPYQLLIP